MSTIYDHTHWKYRQIVQNNAKRRYNGAFYYSVEIVRNIIPAVKTDRSWVTINAQGYACDHAIVFVHNNLRPENYDWLKKYRDLVLVCGVPETCEKVKHLGRAVYLPLSIDVAEVKRHSREKDREVCFAGRMAKATDELPDGIDYLHGVPRGQFLDELARYEKVYAVGRVALEARALGCEVLAYDPRFPDPEVWQVLDNKDAAAMLQKELDKIDG